MGTNESLLSVNRHSRRRFRSSSPRSPTYRGSPQQVPSAAMDTEILKLNVGGRKIMTTKATLAPPSEPNSLFAAMFRSERPPTKMDADGNMFIDQNPDRFEIILDYLRTGILPEELQCPLELLKADADYFGIEGLLKIIGQRKTEEQRRRTAEQSKKIEEQRMKREEHEWKREEEERKEREHKWKRVEHGTWREEKGYKGTF